MKCPKYDQRKPDMPGDQTAWNENQHKQQIMEADLRQLKVSELSSMNFKNNVLIMFKEIKVKLET